MTTLDIKAKHIRKGYPRRTMDCAIAVALKEQLGDTVRIVVWPESIVIGTTQFRCSKAMDKFQRDGIEKGKKYQKPFTIDFTKLKVEDIDHH